MEIGSSLGDDSFEYFDEDAVDDDEVEHEIEEGNDANKVPMDKFGWFYKVCTKINKYSNIYLTIIGLLLL